MKNLRHSTDVFLLLLLYLSAVSAVSAVSAAAEVSKTRAISKLLRFSTQRKLSREKSPVRAGLIGCH